MEQHIITIEAAARHLALQILELEKRMDIHMKYQQEALASAAKDMDRRLDSMNEFRDQLREQAAEFVTMDALLELERRQGLFIETVKSEMIKRAEINLSKIDDLQRSITPGLGPRVAVLELAKSNLDGRFWALAALVVILDVVMQLWPLLRPH